MSAPCKERSGLLNSLLKSLDRYLRAAPYLIVSGTRGRENTPMPGTKAFNNKKEFAKKARVTMLAAGLSPQEPYPGKAGLPWECICKICKAHISPTYNAIQQGKGCRFCAAKLRGLKQKEGQAEAAVKIMLEAKARPLVPYPGAFTGWLSECLLCGAEITPMLNNVRKEGRGACKHCGRVKGALSKRRPIEEVRKSLISLGATPLVKYPGVMSKPWKSRCNTCKKVIYPVPLSTIFRSSNPCVYCSHTAVDPLDAKDLMMESGLKPLEPYPGARPRWKCRCMRCGLLTYPHYESIKAGGGGCINCSRSKIKKTPNAGRYKKGTATRTLNEAQAIARMRKAGVDPVTPYPGSNALPWLSKCKRCGSIVNSSFSTCTDARGNGGCKRCASVGRAAAQRIEPRHAKRMMVAAGARPLEPYKDGASPWLCECMQCGRRVRPKLSVVNQGNTPCPGCPEGDGYGFNYYEPAIVYLITHPILGIHKIGIAGTGSKRLKVHSFGGWEVHRTMTFEKGTDAYLVEQSVLNWMRYEMNWPVGITEGSGWTETVSGEHISLPQIWRKTLNISKKLRDFEVSKS